MARGSGEQVANFFTQGGTAPEPTEADERYEATGDDAPQDAEEEEELRRFQRMALAGEVDEGEELVPEDAPDGEAEPEGDAEPPEGQVETIADVLGEDVLEYIRRGGRDVRGFLLEKAQQQPQQQAAEPENPLASFDAAINDLIDKKAQAEIAIDEARMNGATAADLLVLRREIAAIDANLMHAYGERGRAEERVNARVMQQTETAVKGAFRQAFEAMGVPKVADEDVQAMWDSLPEPMRSPQYAKALTNPYMLETVALAQAMRRMISRQQTKGKKPGPVRRDAIPSTGTDAARRAQPPARSAGQMSLEFLTGGFAASKKGGGR